jgi:hypothetical protein
VRKKYNIIYGSYIYSNCDRKMILDRVENFLFRMESFFRVEKGWADEVLIPQAQAQPTISRTYHMSVHIWPAIFSPSVPYLQSEAPCSQNLSCSCRRRHGECAANPHHGGRRRCPSRGRPPGTRSRSRGRPQRPRG